MSTFPTDLLRVHLSLRHFDDFCKVISGVFYCKAHTGVSLEICERVLVVLREKWGKKEAGTSVITVSYHLFLDQNKPLSLTIVAEDDIYDDDYDDDYDDYEDYGGKYKAGGGPKKSNAAKSSSKQPSRTQSAPSQKASQKGAAKSSSKETTTSAAASSAKKSESQPPSVSASTAVTMQAPKAEVVGVATIKPSDSAPADLPSLDSLSPSLLQEPTSKKHVSIVVMGHVDAGKSTLLGHLLFFLGSVDAQQKER